MRPLRFVRLWLGLGWLFVALVIFFSLTPSPPSPIEFTGADKLFHVSTYALMMLWFGLVYLPGRAYLLLGIGLILMGIALELIQGLTGYRSLEYVDMIANAVGVSFGWLLVRTRLSSTLLHVEAKILRHKS